MNRRGVHPLAWWMWALALGAAALRTRNPLLLGTLVAATWFVVAARRPDAPWARSFGTFVRLGVVIVVFRLVLQMLFGLRLPGHVLFTIPQAHLPSWTAGMTLGGPVTSEAMVTALYDGLQLAVLLACVGAANSLASPYRLLRAMPSVLYELGMVITVALSFAPQAGISARRVRDARRLRGRPTRGVAGIRGMAMPVLEGALERSLQLASSMDSRGYGRRGTDPRILPQAAMGAGVVATGIGTYGVLDASAPSGLGVPMLLAGGVLLAVSLAVAGAGSLRTRYRPEPWGLPELATAGAGIATLAGLVIAARTGVHGLTTSTFPLELPTFPLLPAAAIAIAALPGIVTPDPTKADLVGGRR